MPATLIRAPLRALLFALALLATLPAPAAAAGWPSFALYYGPDPPLSELQAFDRVVLEPEHAPPAAQLPARHTRWYAYVSVIEAAPTRDWLRDVPAAWQRGDNPVWGSRLINQAAPGWAEFFERRVIAPLWQQGWRGFFLDTLDSYHLYARTPEARRAQEDALVALVERLHARFPGIELVFNRGFEILPRLRGKVAAVAAESLYRGWDRAGRTYRDVPAADRDWLLAQLARVRDEHRIPVVVVDYAPLAERAAARATAARIRAAGFVPWIAAGDHDALGVGDIEVQPRRIALVTDRTEGSDFQQATAFRYLAAPLGYLGYTVEPIDVQGALPEHLANGTYAAIVTWFSQPVRSLNPRFAGWLKQQLDAGLRLVLMNEPGLDLESALLRDLGFEPVRQPAGRLSIVAQDPLVGFEAAPPLAASEVAPLRRSTGTQLLRLAAADGTTIDAVGLAPWGGYAFAPYAFAGGTLDVGARWVVDPIEFLRRALAAPDFPVPDVTTEGGRRLLLVHVDGDGFASRAEVPGSPFAPEVLLRDVLARYRIPHTVSVIQGEIAGNGMFRDLAPALEAIARRIFALPHVEIASHSYSHPFVWRALARTGPAAGYEGRALNLVLPGYRFDLQAEIAGSAAYIDERLAPAGKKTRVFLWTGDTVPTAEAVEAAGRAGLLNMNGGDTLITRSAPTLTLVAGLGLRRGSGFQVFAPNQNENVYTNNWTGPYYGYLRAIETFELTETPRRLKPVDIYYHTYSASKQASLAALHRVYGWALAQPLVPVYASDYIRKVLDFESIAIARDWRAPQPTWRVRGAGELRTLRLPAAAPLALAASRNVAGARPGPNGRYLHLTAAAAAVVVAPERTPPVHVYEANGWIGDFQRDPRGLRFALSSYYRPAFTLAHADGCRVRVGERELRPASNAAGLLRYELAHDDPAATPAQSLVDVRCG